jgi:hypothetical protein
MQLMIKKLPLVSKLQKMKKNLITNWYPMSRINGLKLPNNKYKWFQKHTLVNVHIYS